MPEVSRYEHELVTYGMKELSKIQGLHLIGTAANKSSALSFVLDGTSNDAVGQILDQHGIAVRVGDRCAQPIIGHNSVIGGNAFITASIPSNTRVSIKNQELEYKTWRNEPRSTSEVLQSNEWYYII